MTETKKENEREIVLAILIEVLEKNQFSHIVIRYPEQAFLMVGTIDDVKEKAKEVM